MKLPHLDQLVPLERGDAGVLAKALAVLVRDVTQAKRPVSKLEALLLTPLAGLTKKLVQIHQREQLAPPKPGRKAKPRNLRVTYDQMAVLMHYRHTLYFCGLEEWEYLQVQVVVGKFQQKSLNLAHFIKFS